MNAIHRMMNQPKPTSLPPDIRQVLARLRRRIRAYIWIEGISAVLAVLGLAFWLGLAIDWLIEPSPQLRAVAIGLVAVVLVAVIYRKILARAFARFADTSMAVLVEKYYAQFRDSLVTSVELSQLPDHADPFDPQMLSQTHRQAVEGLPTVRLNQLFNPLPLVRNVAAAGVLCLSVVAFGLLARDAFGFYLDRLQLSEQLWPRRVRLVVDGFPEPRGGAVKVARGADYELQIKAAATPPYEIPAHVEVRYPQADGSRGRDARRIGQALPGRDEWQEYSYSFKGLLETQTFDVVGGDDRIRDLKLEVVDSPEIVEMALHCEYPSYMQRAPRALSVTGAMEIPHGTKITIRAKSNKTLSRVKILDPDASEPTVLDLVGAAADRQSFQFAMPPLTKDRLLLFVLRDDDGIETIEPYRLSLVAAADQAPQVTAALHGIGTSITPQARLPVSGTVADDYGIDRVWLEHRVDDAKPGETPLDRQPQGENELAITQVLEAETLHLVPKQKLLLGVKAADRYDLDNGPHVGTSQRFLLEVVTPDELRTILEGRELLLRKRFETIYNELIATRDQIARVDFTPPGAPQDEAPSSGSDKDPAEPEEETPKEEADAPSAKAKAEEQAPKAESGKETAADGADDAAAQPDGKDAAAERALARRRLRVMGALQNVERSGHETVEVAGAFDNIYEELVNNQIATDELKKRLVEGIAQPLRRVGGPMTARLVELLHELDANVTDPQAGAAARDDALAQADAVLLEMKQALDRMLELESYNEVLEILRQIVQEQQQLNEQTKEQRKRSLQKLLEDND